MEFRHPSGWLRMVEKEKGRRQSGNGVPSSRSPHRGAITQEGDPNYFTASDRPAPALNFGVFLALILIVSPVAGLRPVRAARLVTENVPKPGIVTLSPFFSVFVIVSRVALSARSASAFVRSVAFAMASTSSPLFITVQD